MQYALQCRRDEAGRQGPAAGRAEGRCGSSASAAARFAAGPHRGGVARGEFRRAAGQQRGRALLIYATAAVADLADGSGWDAEYPRDTWRLRRLGIGGPQRHPATSAGIPQPWLKDLAKRWTRWRLAAGLSLAACGAAVRV